jgi:hypothetical protein
MTNDPIKQSRRKFISWGIASAAVVSACKFFKSTPEKKTVKMLTQDGKLVEVDMAALPQQKKKASNQDVKNWIKR